MKTNDLKSIRTTKELIDTIEQMGYSEKPKNGSSHRVFCKSGKPVLSIPDHKTLSPGTKRNIVKLILGESYYGK